MDDSTPERPTRRPRYRGSHPRAFGEKYKEHRPDRYPDDVARVIAGGGTPAGTHRPILVAEVLRVLAPRPGEVAVDCTLGYGGHARAILDAIGPGGRLIALDADPVELPKAAARLRDAAGPAASIEVHRANFAGLAAIVAERAPGGVDLLVADLGLSSMQLDDPDRGFTFKADGPLDMRMDPESGRPASDFLTGLGDSALATLLDENADEPRAREVAAAILRAHRRAPIATTGTLARVVRDAAAGWAHPAGQGPGDVVRRVFQAIRIAVNDEFGALSALLDALPGCLGPGGRAAILSFHSGEDRRVKLAFREGLRSGVYAAVADDVIRPSPEERRENPRSSPAKLRFAIRAVAAGTTGQAS